MKDSAAVELPDRVDLSRARVSVVPTTVEILRASAFLDGRTPVANGAGRNVPIAELPARGKTPVAMLLHVSYCGSTLLSRLLDVPGRTVSLREPRVQVDLADWRAALGHETASSALSHAIRGTTALLGRAVAGERVIVKPTNWANVLLPEWASTPDAIDPVFLTMAPHAFLVAVFRGGRERLAFTMRGAAHFASVRPNGAEIIAAAMAASTDPLDRAAHLAVVTFGLQHALFVEGRAHAGWAEERMVDFATLRADPIGTALRIVRLLNLPLDDGHIAARVTAAARQDAKAPDRSFAPADEETRDADVLLHHADRIAAALRWGEREGLV